MHHPPTPAFALVPPRTGEPPRMPRALRFLRVLFSLMGTIAALMTLYYLFLLLSLYLYPSTTFEEWLSVQGFFAAELWVMPALHALRAASCAVAATRLGGGGRTGRRWARVAVGVEAGAILVGAAVGVAALGVVSVFDAVLWVFSAAVGLLFPGLLFLLLLVARSSREWFRATGA
ncbi:hypothetical protein ACFW53_10585 [Nocardiopsis dassonvillei]|uniref:hypothetical protein n=1 Tax=Nocardiopsis dassonvillei TaxID=2014 RepID=UPI001E59BDBE|nr:hypothetical protein [Nocardiopsis dassonvillei]